MSHLTTRCPNCGSNSWRTPDNPGPGNDIHRQCDDCGQEYWMDISYEEQPRKTNPLDRQVDGSHYKKLKIQPVQYSRANGLLGLESAVIKYTTRHKDKNGAVDIDKAIHCLQLIKAMDYPDEQ